MNDPGDEHTLVGRRMRMGDVPLGAVVRGVPRVLEHSFTGVVAMRCDGGAWVENPRQGCAIYDNEIVTVLAEPAEAAG